MHSISWPAKSTFCLRNKIFAGNPQDKSVSFLTYFMTLAFPFYFNMCFVPYVIYGQWSSYLLYLYWFFFLLTIYNLISTQFKDPGIILRGNLVDPNMTNNDIDRNVLSSVRIDVGINENDENEIQEKLKKDNNELLSENYANFKYSENLRDLNVGFYKQRYCVTCKIMRPPKASHCWHCDQCVKGFDHHCFFVGNCVGIRNWRNFILFIFFGFLFALYDLILSVVTVIEIFNFHPEIYEAFKNETPLFIATLVFLFLSLCCMIFPFNFMMKSCVFLLFLFLLIMTFAISISNTNKNLVYYENPCFMIVNISAVIPLTFWLFILSFMNFVNVLNGLTLKESSSVNKTMRSNNIRNLSYNLSCKEKMINLFNFLTFKVPPSEIFG